MTIAGIDRISDVIRAVAEDKIVPRFEQLQTHEIRTKSGPGDLVTIADEEAEIELTRILTDLYPGCGVVGEEAVSSGRVTRDILNGGHDMVFVVDPVDGTHNFAHGKPVFGTMIALVKGGERIASWIYQIPRRRMIHAVKGQGVFMDEKPYTPPKPPQGMDLSAMKAFISRKFMPPPIRPYMEDKIKLVADATTHFCCAWEYVDILEGNAAFSIYSRIEPWDHLAGVLFLEEAGYYVRKWDKQPYLPSQFHGGLINAPSKELWDVIYREFMEEPLRILGRA